MRAAEAPWVPIPTSEDLVLQKLRWARETRSEQQQKDVVAILRGQETMLDWDHLWRWADTLGVREDLGRLKVEAENV